MAGCLAPGGCGPVFDAVDDAIDDADDEVVPDDVDEVPGITGKPVVGLMPGGISGSGAGVMLCPGAGAPDAIDGASPLRRAGARRFTLVETKPVVPAPEPGAIV